MSVLVEKPRDFLSDIKRQASSAACSSKFYHWLLSSGATPTHIAVKMVDPWAGDVDVGRAMLRGHYLKNGADIQFFANMWIDAEQQTLWAGQIHEFSWLRDLRAVGGDAPRMLARQLVDQWMDRYDRWDPQAWRADVMGQRLAMWLAFFDFFCGSADEEFQAKYFASINKQARHLSRSFPSNLQGIDLLKAAKGLVFAGLSFAGRESWILQGFEVILDELPKQILSDGGHISRNPQNLIEVLHIILDLRCALNRAKLPVPDVVQHAIDRAGQALRFFRYGDKKLALFHGAQEGDIALMDALQTQAAAPSKILRSLPESGFERAQIGRSLLMLDTSPVASMPYDKNTHASPLAFEFTYGRDRVFVNCGGHPVVPEWQQVLRHTAAHTALTLDGKPAYQIRADGHIQQRTGRIKCHRTENRDSCLLEAVHHGYTSLNGITHKRRLYLSSNGLDLRGEDTLSAEIVPTHAVPVSIRFHLHPRNLISINDKKDEISIRLPCGIGFQFFVVGGQLSLENSIYLGVGAKPIKTRQIVITTDISAESKQIKWALQKE